MKTLQIRNVPDDVHRALRIRAAAAGVSLSDYALGELERAAERPPVAEVLQHLEVTEATYYRWRNQYGAMGPDEAKRLKELEVENARLKKLLAEAELDKAILKEVAEGKW